MLWPTEPFSGFYVHWTCGYAAEGPLGDTHATDQHVLSPFKLKPCGEFSTIDTAEMTMGALFAGNYFGGELHSLALDIARSVDWNKAIKSANDPTIFPVVNGTTGQMGGTIR